MSVGPGKSRVFRADDPSASREPVIKRRPAEPPAPVKASKPTMRTPPKSEISAHKGPLEPIRVQHRLVLSEKQQLKLQALFMAPKALATLIRGYEQPLKTAADASVFLLANRKALDGFINPETRERSVNLLTELLLQWAGNPPDSIGIDFDDVSLTPDQKVYLPLEGFRAVTVQSPMGLSVERKGRRFSTPFTLFEQEKRFYVAFTLEPKAPSVPAQIKPKEIKLLPGQPLPYISGRRDAPREPRQRILFSRYSGVFTGGVKTMNWSGLSGWGVNGGLPSLGKRSR